MLPLTTAPRSYDRSKMPNRFSHRFCPILIMLLTRRLCLTVAGHDD
jgi:hypothetical protein